MKLNFYAIRFKGSYKKKIHEKIIHLELSDSYSIQRLTWPWDYLARSSSWDSGLADDPANVVKCKLFQLSCFILF